MLSEIVKMSGNDTIFVTSSRQYDNDDYSNRQDFYFYNRKTKTKIFPYGYQIAFPFVGKTALVKYNDRWGLIDRSGRFIYYTGFPGGVRLSSYEKFVLFYGNENNKIIYNMYDGTKQESSIYCAMPATPDYFVSEIEKGKYNLINRKRETIFKTEMDSIISKQAYIYKENTDQNLLILKKKNKYGLYLSDGSEIVKIKYEKAKFVGNYIMLFENNIWKYYTYENNKLSLILSTPFECNTSAYQTQVIGVFKKDNKYNLLKISGETLPESFDYISDNATYGIKENALVTFDAEANYYTYTEN